ncbi:DUF1697 domain-containing protein [Paenibacillus xylanivorans]|uniref:DUF1697 domain-containing protein n=1 Tax=Paenibacillus xylanivorans TaxID=1705561 RepID=A0A0M9BNA9_9BACL|nr:DUF1697 domain-containing protein [Paenibacillus xylanivorans]KOY15820.1 hypothetical protein AMS66_14290 [Paenibacillus xylanivorans]
MIYVALLRGINVGGNNKINMKQLKETFEQVGLLDVVTYINSGNIIFADHQERVSANEELAQILEQAIAVDFGLQIKVMVRNLDEVRTVVQALPEEWTNDATAKSDVMFLWDEVNDVSVLDKLPIKPEIGTLLYVPGAILYSVSKELVTKSGMSKLIGSKVYKYMTVRNVNTTRQIYKLMQAAAER